MLKHQISMTIVAAALALSPATRAMASAGDVAAGVLLGVIGTSVVNSANRRKKATRRYYSTTSGVQRAENREVQTSLNYFGFPAGRPDGVMGRNSRNAVAQYQVFMGYPATGQLTGYELTFLTTAYHRAVAGGGATMQMASTNPLGIKGVLKVYQQESAGAPVAVAPNTTIVVAPQAPVAIAPAAPVPAITATLPSFGKTALPSFMGNAQEASLASHCNKVSLLTNTNGGFITEASMTDANFALNEQFCLARTYAISQGEDLASHITGFTQAQIAQQCAGLAPALKEQIAALSLKPEADVMRDVGSFVLQSGAAPTELSSTAKVCLSVGYRTDNMPVALASALLLTVLGEPAYAELLGHHLSQGFGVTRRPDLSLAWYQTALDALAAGATPVFAPGQPERTGLIRKAAYQVGGASNGANALPTPQPATQTVTLPSFSSGSN